MKEWWKKEAQFSEAYRAGRQATDLWKYIPKSKLEGVADTAVDQDGYWVYLSEGYTAYSGGSDCRVIHEYTIADLRETIKTIRREAA